MRCATRRLPVPPIPGLQGRVSTIAYTVSAADAIPRNTLEAGRLQTIRQRLGSGYYTNPDVTDAIARCAASALW